MRLSEKNNTFRNMEKLIYLLIFALMLENVDATFNLFREIDKDWDRAASRCGELVSIEIAFFISLNLSDKNHYAKK